MPLSGDPNDTVPFSLETDRDKPEAERPTFLLRFMSYRDRRTVAGLLTQAAQEKDDEQTADLLDQAIGVALADVRNVRHKGEPVTVPDEAPSGYLTPSELWELAGALLERTRLAEDDRKKSSSQSTSAPAGSATNAGLPAAA